jgi:hypothetical protein
MPFVKPSNAILVGGSPLVEELVTEGTSVKPGLLVIKGTGDHQVGLAGDGARNVLGVVDSDPRYKITDAFPDKHPVRVLKGPIVVVCTLKSGQNVAKGARLDAAANGELKANAGKAVNEGGTATYTIYWDTIIGYAEESVDASAAAKPIMVRLVI